VKQYCTHPHKERWSVWPQVHPQN